MAQCLSINLILCILVNEDFEPVSDGTMIVFTSCDLMQDLTFNIIDDGELENDENIVVTLSNVTLTHIGNGSILDLSDEEKNRLIWNMTETRITIQDDDSTFMCLGSLAIFRFCVHDFSCRCYHWI